MLQGYTHNQALRMYRKYGVRVAVPLSTAALRKVRQQRAASSAGLAELSLVSDPYMVRGRFQSETEFQMELLAMRAQVHAATLAAELHN